MVIKRAGASPPGAGDEHTAAAAAARTPARRVSGGEESGLPAEEAEKPRPAHVCRERDNVRIRAMKPPQDSVHSVTQPSGSH